MKTRHYIRLFIVAALIFSCRCGMNVAGNSSQTGNNGITVCALAKSISGTTQPRAKISIYSQSYLPYANPPGFSDSTTADDSGKFSFSMQADGYYNLYVRGTGMGGSAFLQQIPVFTDSLFADTLDSLSSPGYFSGTATNTESDTIPLSYVFISGSPFYDVTGNKGEFFIGPLPTGYYTVEFYGIFILRGDQFISNIRGVANSSTVTVYPDSISQWHW